MIPYGIGTQVVCIVERWWLNPAFADKPHKRPPIKGAVYTITGHGSGRDFNTGEILECIMLAEFDDQLFPRLAFRPVRPTSIELFRSLLTPKDKVLENAT